jgi:hypothetical protein
LACFCCFSVYRNLRIKNKGRKHIIGFFVLFCLYSGKDNPFCFRLKMWGYIIGKQEMDKPNRHIFIKGKIYFIYFQVQVIWTRCLFLEPSFSSLIDICIYNLSPTMRNVYYCKKVHNLFVYNTPLQCFKAHFTIQMEEESESYL